MKVDLKLNKETKPNQTKPNQTKSNQTKQCIAKPASKTVKTVTAL